MADMEKVPDMEKGLFDLIDGLKDVSPDVLGDFRRAMDEEVIPEIVRVVEERRLAAASSRHCQLKC